MHKCSVHILFLAPMWKIDVRNALKLPHKHPVWLYVLSKSFSTSSSSHCCYLGYWDVLTGQTYTPCIQSPWPDYALYYCWHKLTKANLVTVFLWPETLLESSLEGIWEIGWPLLQIFAVLKLQQAGFHTPNGIERGCLKAVMNVLTQNHKTWRQ